MRSDYKILWIDDREDWVDPIKEAVADHLEDLGLTLTVDLFKNDTGIEERLSDPELDLIIVDYNLSGQHGDAVIRQIRDGESYVEIVFYSANDDINELVSSLDGVYRCHRDHVGDKILKVIDVTLRRSQSIDNMRGYVIAESIEIENEIELLLSDYYGSSQKEIFHNYMSGLDFAKKKNFLVSLIKGLHCEVIDQNNGRDNELSINLTAVKNAMAAFDSDVIHPRNTMAHVRKEVDGSGVVTLRNLRGGGRIQHSAEWCIETRKNLRKYKTILSQLREYIIRGVD